MEAPASRRVPPKRFKARLETAYLYSGNLP